MTIPGQKSRLLSAVCDVLWLVLKPWLPGSAHPRVFWYRSRFETWEAEIEEILPQAEPENRETQDPGARFWPERSNCDFLVSPRPRFFGVQPEWSPPAVKRVSPVVLGPTIDAIPPERLVLRRGSIHAVPIEPFSIPTILGRKRRLPRGAAPERRGDKTISRGDGTPVSGEPGLIPSELWNLLWEILSPPPRVEELIERKYPGRLRPYQVEGVQRLIEKERFILADEMGAGKTVQVCVALSLLIRLGRIKTALIICPKTVLSVWYDHLKAWLPEAETHSHHQVEQLRWAQRNGRPQVWVVPYSRLARRAAGLTWDAKWDVVVLDEVHEIRNPNTNKYREIKVLIEEARYRWGLSGTPLQNRLEELTAIFGTIKPELKLQVDGTPLPQVREIIRPYLRRVRRKDALPDLPPKHRREIWLEMDAAQARAYHAVRQSARIGLGGQTMGFTHIWQVLTQLKKICNFAPDSFDSPKLRKLLEVIKMVSARGEKVVVFTQFRAAGLIPLMHHLKPFGMAVIYGNTADEDRRRAVRQFQDDPRCRVFLGTVQTSGHGLTLTAANHVVHFDHWWNPAVSWQAEDRVYRIGQTRPVTVYEFWMKGTVEERIRKILEAKGLLHDEVIERLSDSEFKKCFTLEELLGLLEDRPGPTGPT